MCELLEKPLGHRAATNLWLESYLSSSDSSLVEWAARLVRDEAAAHLVKLTGVAGSQPKSLGFDLGQLWS